MLYKVIMYRISLKLKTMRKELREHNRASLTRIVVQKADSIA